MIGALIHLVYASAAKHSFTEDELIELLTSSRKSNFRNHVTGMLLYSEGSFFQVLEGEKTVVEALFQTITADTRHTKITRIIQEPIPARAFSEWSMAFSGASPEQLQSIEGLNDFFNDGSCLAEIDMGRAKKLLNAFSQGRWRQTLR